jgi:hypothetical protein
MDPEAYRQLAGDVRLPRTSVEAVLDLFRGLPYEQRRVR